MPLTATGKIDRLRLPDPDHSRPDLKQSFVAPRTPLEEQIAAIWSEVLNIPAPGIHDNFFDLGGHSLLATQLISRFRSQMSIENPLRCLFEEPTIAGLALEIVKARAEQAAEPDISALLGELERLSDEEIDGLMPCRSPDLAPNSSVTSGKE